ncbi:MAG: glycosyltransferase family 4 protein, partial [Deltaproteobacteria bacterium]|nr:glycosyltransferase family 4 protein [Deltaproteobacteria bacterium]
GARFRVLLRSTKLAEAIPAHANVEIDLLPERGLLGRFAFLYGRAAGIAREWAADVYFSVAEYAPSGTACPTVVCLRNPNVFTSLEQGWGLYQTLRLGLLRQLATRSAHRAARVVFVSRDSAGWIGEAAGVAPGRRAVLHHGIDPEAWRARAGPAAGVDHGILSVSTIYRYKNFVRLIEAYRLLASRPEWLEEPDALPDLTIVGDDQDPLHSAQMRAARAAAGDLAAKIHLVGTVPYLDVPAWYLGSKIFVFPSYLETFGHPMLEAMASGLPVAASDLPVFREIGGDAVHYFDAQDVTKLADSMHELLSDEGLRQKLVERGRRRIADFTWDASAEKLLAVLAEAAGGEACG